MLKDKSSKWLNKSVKQFKRLVWSFRYRFFDTDEKEIDVLRKDVLDRLLHQMKLMQEELDERVGRT